MKMKLIYAALILAFAACQSPPKVDMSAQNTALIQQYFAHFNSHNWQKMAEMYANTAEFKDPSLGKGIVKQTHKDIIAKYGELQKTFPDVKDDIGKIYVSGDKNVIVEFVSRGTAPDNTAFELPICTIFTIENGKITKDFTYYDNF